LSGVPLTTVQLTVVAFLILLFSAGQSITAYQ
jgi:hypothetical protein